MAHTSGITFPKSQGISTVHCRPCVRHVVKSTLASFSAQTSLRTTSPTTDDSRYSSETVAHSV